jgi:hypothetical protein
MTTLAPAPTVTRRPERPGADNLGSANQQGDEFLLIIDGQAIAGTYYCTAREIRPNQRWASWGPAGLSMGHRTREDAEQVQVDAYDPSDYTPPAPEPEPEPISAPVATPVGPPTAELAIQVDEHMVSNFPSTPAGDWEVARDPRDLTAVVVWRLGTMGFTQPGVRGAMLYRWLCSLHDAGFVVQSRLDMEVFGRPDEESPDGYAHWLHITGWSEPQPRVRNTCLERSPRPMYRHRVTAHPTDPNPFGGPTGYASSRPIGYHFTYWAPDVFPHPITYAIEYATHSEGMSILPPDWLVALAEEHRSCAKAGVWGCRR